VNFPGFDAALFGSHNADASGDSPPRSDANNNNNAGSSSARGDNKNNDTSPSRETDCSFASSNNLNNFSLDLSIGARAALAEHRRHVARYGIDGDAGGMHRPPVDSIHHPGTPHSGDGVSGGGGSSDRSSLSTLRGSPGEGATKNSSSVSGVGISSTSQIKSSPNKHSPPRDDWERFNDGSTHVSFASTFIVHGGDVDDDADDSNELQNVSNIMLGQSFLSDASHGRSGEGMKGDCGNDSGGEIADDGGNDSSADNSPNRSDFFNSSRIHLLATPERNKPIVDEASRRARELAHDNGIGTVAGGDGCHHHITGRGDARDHDDDVFEDTGSSFIGVDDSTIGGGGSTVVGDISGGMAFLFREAMRLNASAASNENGDAQIDSRAEPEVECSDNEEGGDSQVNYLQVESSPSKGFASSFAGFRAQHGSNGAKESFVECNGGIEFVADLSDILSATRTPPRKYRGSPGTSSGSGSGNSNRKPPMDPFSTPRRGSPPRRMRQASNKTESPNRTSDRNKENAGDFNLIALSPIASKAGSEAAKLLSVDTFRYANASRDMAKGSTPPRTPLRQFGSPRTYKVGATGSAKSCVNIARNGGLAPTPERGEPTLSSFLNDSNLSVSMIEGNDQSMLFTHGFSPLRDGLNDDAETTPGRLMRSNSFGSPGDSERRRRRNYTSSEGKFRSRSVDSPERRMQNDLLPRRVVKSLGARYSQPDRFEDNFSPVSATQESTELKSVSRYLLESFET